MLLDPAVGLDGAWMREIADAMLASPDFADRAEARADKTSGLVGRGRPGELERELDEHLIAAAERTRRLADQRAGDDVVLERAGPTDALPQRGNSDDAGARHCAPTRRT